jgi:ABC-2 type transport system ATP-binding protein
VSLAGLLACRISVKRVEPAFAKAMASWNFTDLGGGMEWQGDVAGPDRLRFLGMTSRYVALISNLSLREVGAGGTAG